MQYTEPEPAVRSLVLHEGDPNATAQLLGNGDLRLLTIRRADVWRYSFIDIIGWWTWDTVAEADLPRLVDADVDVLATVQAVVARGSEDADDETDDEKRVNDIVDRFRAWLAEHDVPHTTGSYDEREP